jgi:hypothetical protein
VSMWRLANSFCFADDFDHRMLLKPRSDLGLLLSFSCERLTINMGLNTLRPSAVEHKHDSMAAKTRSGIDLIVGPPRRYFPIVV